MPFVYHLKVNIVNFIEQLVHASEVSQQCVFSFQVRSASSLQFLSGCIFKGKVRGYISA